MILSLALAVLAAFSTLLLLLPLRRPAPLAGERFEHELAIYRDQLAELARDLEAGRIGTDEATAARLEIERRILAADDAARRRPPPASGRQRRLLPWLVALWVPLGGLYLYLELGRPELPAQPFAARAPVIEDPAQAQLEQAIAALRQRLAEQPADHARAVALAQALLAAGRTGEAVSTLRAAQARGGDNIELWATLAEALTLQAEGIVIPEAQGLFRKVLEKSTGDPRARYYLGRADEQAGNARAALERWLALEDEAPAEAPWLAMLSSEIDRLGRSSGIDPRSIRPQRRAAAASVPRGPTQEDIARMQQMSPEERQAAIRSMVEGLELRLKDTPDDLAGWLRLANARKQFGEFARAREALLQADRLRPDDPRILADLAEAMVRSAVPGTPPDAEAVSVLRRLEKLQPDNGLALFYLAEAAVAAGQRDEAITRLRRLLSLIPAEAKVRQDIERRLQEIEAGR